MLQKFSRLFMKVLPVLALSLAPANGQWAFGIGNTNAENVTGIALDAGGNVLITGTFQGIVDFDPSGGTTNLTSAGNTDVFIAKYNSSGALVWAGKVGGSGADVSYGIAVDASSNVFITGYFNSTADFDPGAGTSNLVSNGGTDIFLAKYSSTGSLTWAENIGGTSNELARAIAVDAGGNVYITGEYRSTVDFDPGAGTQNRTAAAGGDIFVAEYTSGGAYVLAIGMGGTSIDAGYGIGVDGVGLITVTGRFQGTADFDPTAGTTNLTSSGGFDIFLAQYDNTGALQFAYGFGQTTDDYALGLAVDGNGGDIYVIGKFEGTVDFNPLAGTTNLTSAGLEDVFFARYDASGSLMFAKNVAGPGSELGNAIAFDGSGNVYITGSYQTTLNDADFDPGAGTAILNGYGLFFAKYNSSGSYVWAKAVTATSGSGNEGNAIAVDGSGNVYVAGVFIETTDFDPGAGTTTVTNNTSNDIFLAKYSSSGVLPVQMTSMDARAHGMDSELRWHTASEVHNYGFDIERRGIGVSNDWMKVGFVAGAGTTNSPHEYSYLDHNLSPGRYAYRIRQIDQDGSLHYTQSVEVEVGSVPKELKLFQNYPNPFNPTSSITFSVPEDGTASLKVYDMVGREVATLFQGDVKAGYAVQATFDARQLASGVYVGRLQFGGKQLLQKMVLMK
ncbi:MAG: T9SS type A sorting domain-containing protein [Bacteroidota bacterium]